MIPLRFQPTRLLPFFFNIFFLYSSATSLSKVSISTLMCQKVSVRCFIQNKFLLVSLKASPKPPVNSLSLSEACPSCFIFSGQPLCNVPVEPTQPRPPPAWEQWHRRRFQNHKSQRETPFCFLSFHIFVSISPKRLRR